jgi:hypothetical protein
MSRTAHVELWASAGGDHAATKMQEMIASETGLVFITIGWPVTCSSIQRD